MLEAIKNLFSRKSDPTAVNSPFNLIKSRESEFEAAFFPTGEDVRNEFAQPYEPRYPNAMPPIIVVGEINDNSLVVLSQITELADQVGIDLFNSDVYQYYQSAVHGEDLPEGLDEDELEVMREWTDSVTLPDRFRLALVEFVKRVDDVGERILNLSQYRYERLRTWSNCHV